MSLSFTTQPFDYCFAFNKYNKVLMVLVPPLKTLRMFVLIGTQ